jgi:hypothetical protein
LRGVDRDLARYFGLAEREVMSARELMPNLHRIVAEDGALIAPPGGAIWASGPNFVSVPGYVEALTGKRSSCESNDCAPIEQDTLLDEAARATGSRLGDVAAIASWPGIRKAAAKHPSRLVLSIGRDEPANEGVLRTDAIASALLDQGAAAEAYPGHGKYRPDEHTAPIALRYLSTRAPRLLFIGLGDTDEYAHRRDYRGYLRALQRADATIGAVASVLARLRERGRETAFFITTDHGRSDGFEAHGGRYPESGQVWLVAAGDQIRARGYPQLGRSARLADVAPTLRAVLRLPSEPAPGAGRPLMELLAPVTANRRLARR